jgi:hypothetical protein
VVATCGNFNFDSVDKRVERRRIFRARERPCGDRPAEGATDGVAHDVAKGSTEKRVAGERGGALGSVRGDPLLCHG